MPHVATIFFHVPAARNRELQSKPLAPRLPPASVPLSSPGMHSTQAGPCPLPHSRDLFGANGWSGAIVETQWIWTILLSLLQDHRYRHLFELYNSQRGVGAECPG